MKRLKFGALLLAASVGTSADAASDLGIQFQNGWTFLPEVDLAYLYDNNLYRQEDKVSASAAIISPLAVLRYDDPGDTYKLGYAGEYGFFDTTGLDNYFDHDVWAEANLNQTGQHRLDLSAGQNQGHDPRGTRRTEAIPLSDRDIDEWAINFSRATYTYGAPTATLNLIGGVDYQKKEYSNNAEVTRYLDYSYAGGMLGLRYRVSPATVALFDVQYHEIKFDETQPPFSTLDGSEYRARAGALWRPNPAFQFRGLAGMFWREADAEDRRDVSSFDWELGMSYSPNSYSLFTVDGGHSTQETYLPLASFIDVQRIAAAWRQGWTDRFSTGVSAAYTEQRFKGTARKDDTVFAGVYLEQDLSGYWGRAPQLVTVRLCYDLENRDSNETVDGLDLDYKRQIFAIHLRIAL